MTIEILLTLALWRAPTQAGAPLDETSTRLVVAPFDEHGTMPGFGSAVADLLIRSIDRPDVVLHERGQFRRVVEERRLAETDLVNRARELGQIEEARLVLVGSVYRLDDRYLLSARIVDLSARIQDGQRGWVIVRTIDDLAGAVEILAVQLGLRREAVLARPDLLLAASPAPPVGEVGRDRVGDLVGAVAPANPFALRLRLEPDAQVLSVGDAIRVRVETERDGWLTLLAIDARGEVTPLVPNRRLQKLEVKARQPRIVPDELGFVLRAAPPVGATRIRAIVTERPIDLGRLESGGPTGVGLALDPSSGLPPAAMQGLGGEWSTAEVEFAVRDGSSRSSDRRPLEGGAASPSPPEVGAGKVPVPTPPPSSESPRVEAPSGSADATSTAPAAEGSHGSEANDGELGAERGSRSVARLGGLTAEIPLSEPPSPEAWHLGGDHGVAWTPAHATLRPPVIALIDAGFDFRDQRLAHAWLRDGAGAVVCVDLVNAAGTRVDPPSEGVVAGHGQAVASLIAARRLENSPSVQGILPLATLLPIVVTSDDPGPRWRTPRGDAQTILQALRTARDLGARVVNCSLGVPMTGEELARLGAEPIWDELEQAGVVVVCAAGNDGRDLDLEPSFPASIARSNVLAVAASDPEGRLAEVPGGFRSAWGPRTVGIAAPGVRLPVAGVRGETELADGTSYAAALVTAAAAAALAADPSLTAAQVVAVLRDRSTPSEASQEIGGGIACLPPVPVR